MCLTRSSHKTKASIYVSGILHMLYLIRLLIHIRLQGILPVFGLFHSSVLVTLSFLIPSACRRRITRVNFAFLRITLVNFTFPPWLLTLNLSGKVMIFYKTETLYLFQMYSPPSQTIFQFKKQCSLESALKHPHLCFTISYSNLFLIIL